MRHCAPLLLLLLLALLVLALPVPVPAALLSSRSVTHLNTPLALPGLPDVGALLLQLQSTVSTLRDDLADVRSRLAAAEDELTLLRAEVPAISTRVNNAETLAAGSSALVDAVLSMQAANVTQLPARVTAAEDSVAAHSSQLAALASSNTSLTARMSAAEASTNELAARVTAAEQLDPASSTQLVNTVIGLKSSNATLSSSLDALSARISAAEELAGGTTLANTVGEHTTQLAQLQLANASTADRVSSLELDATTTSATLTTYGGILTTHTAQIAALQAANATTNTRITVLEGSTAMSSAAFTAQIATLQASNASTVADLTALTARVTAVENLSGVTPLVGSVTAALTLSGSSSLVATVKSLNSSSAAHAAAIANIQAIDVLQDESIDTLQLLEPVTFGGEDMIIWQGGLSTPLQVNWNFTGPQKLNVPVPGLPAGARVMLADVFATMDVRSDALSFQLGRDSPTFRQNATAWFGKFDRPSVNINTSSSALLQQAVLFSYPGGNDGFSPMYGLWWSSQMIALNPDGSFTFTNPGINSALTQGYLTAIIRDYSRPSFPLLPSPGAPLIDKLVQELPVPQPVEFHFVGQTAFNVSVASLVPQGATYILANVFVSLNNSGHMSFRLGRGSGIKAGVKTWVDVNGQSPAAQFDNLRQDDAVVLNMPGDADKFNFYFGQWFSSQLIALNADGSFTFASSGNASISGWMYVQVRGYSVPVSTPFALANRPIVWQELPSPFATEVPWAGRSSVETIGAQELPVPRGARYVLADVGVVANISDHINLWLGRGVQQLTTWLTPPSTGPRLAPSLSFKSSLPFQGALCSTYGEGDGNTAYYSQWCASQWLPLNADGSLDVASTGGNANPLGGGWAYLIVRAYST